MKSSEIRKQFLDFFESKQHKIVDSAPIVNKDDPTLMFVNAGMVQFKDYFLGNKKPSAPRIADTQKCLRVSGKHNDLEEVGIDSYHHTMFEMLGNWSFGDYFKKEAIDWAWQFLTKVIGLEPDRLYASCFEGDKVENLDRDVEAAEIWKKYLPENRILYFDKKDNFWEMGDTGPCGPCSEIHIDLRSDEDRAKVDGASLVNMDHPLVIEIWNLVFIQYNRKADSSLENLPEKHVDTGMGFERLCMAVQAKKSNYDTDVFMPFIQKIEEASGKKYTYSYEPSAKVDIAMRVVSDHLRAVSFTIADGQLPSNTGAGYVIRRILRRAVRYYYSFLEIKKPFLNTLIPLLADTFADVFPELKAQMSFVQKVVHEEEKSFLRTLEGGLRRIEAIQVENNVLDGLTAFELYDTYGFPIDLTRLIASEIGWEIDEMGFEKALQDQKNRGRQDAKKVMGDWYQVHSGQETDFVGYDQLCLENAKLLRHRTVLLKDKPQYQLVTDNTVFYPEGGGQVGDQGYMWFGDELIKVLDTKKENDLIIHIVHKLPDFLDAPIKMEVNDGKRTLTENNHSSTHLLHAALKEILGEHVNQKGSLVNSDYLRFDFSHFQKLTGEEITQIEHLVNRKIRENIALKEDRQLPIEEAKKAGAMMLFGEKYGDQVRMITFDPNYSVELCGGCHVNATGQIGLFKITSESAVAAGVRRIEAVTAAKAETYVDAQIEELNNIKGMFKNPVNVTKNVYDLTEENKQLKKQLEKLMSQQAAALQDQLKSSFVTVNDVNFLAVKLPFNDAKAAKTLAYNLEKEVGNAFILFGIDGGNGKAQLMVAVSKVLADSGRLHAGNIVKELGKEINGGGGGQAFFATAGGKNPAGIETALEKAKSFL